MSSIDLIPPGLQDQLVQLRSPHAAASDHLWRTERMVRYAYWLRSNRQATFNLFGSWTRADMETEIAFWSTFGQDAVSDEIVAAGEAQIQARYEIDLESAIGLTSRLELATHHLPLWNAATCSLVPQVLGSFRILGATDNETSNPGLGHTIRFQPESGGRYLDLYIYGRSETVVPEGARNADVFNEFSAVSRDIGIFAASRGLSLVSNHEAEIETIESERGTRVEFCADCWVLVNPVEETRQLTALSIRGFRGHFLKIRYSAPEQFVNSEEGAAELAAINSDLAEFVELYGER